MIRSVGIAVAAAIAVAGGTGSAAAVTQTTAIPAADAPGPKRYDRVFVTKVGPRRADRVLVLVPGTIGGAGDFSLVARDLVERVPDLRVWIVDRRSQALEDASVFAQALDGEASADDAFDYYLRWLADPSIQPHYQPLDDDEFGFVREWGLEVAIRDVRRVSSGRQGAAGAG
jgi:hypothetical protein